ncbi:MAG: hypothetical protein KDJ90_00080 [Nitratireductor sp.]|nr:hypothetical protein [Nitratireductor sp.]
MTKSNPFRYFKTSPEVIRLAVMLYVRFPLSLRNVEGLLHESGIDISHETVRLAFGFCRIARVESVRAVVCFEHQANAGLTAEIVFKLAVASR